MKKRIFLVALMISVLALMLAITSFASDIVVSRTEDAEYGTVIQLNADPGLENAAQYVSTLKKINNAGTDTSSLCILTDGNADNPSYYVFPSSYIVDEREDGKFDLVATQLATAIADFNTANGTNYYAAYATDNSGGAKRLNSIVRFVFPSSVASASDSVCCMRSYSNLVEVRINHAIDFSSASKMFYQNTKLETVIGFENVDGAKLSKTMFASCSALRYIKLPTNITKIPGSFFQGAKGVNVVNMAELTQLTVIDSWAFDGTQNLVITLPDSVTTLNTSAFESAFKQGGSITINPTSQLTTIGNKAFASANVSSIYIPSTVTSIGENAFHSSGITTLENFENCKITTIKKSTFEAASKLTSIKIPETVTTIENAFLGNKNLKKVYIPASVTSIADTFVKSSWSEAPTNLVFLYIGNDVSVFANCAAISGATKILSSNYNETTSYTGINLVVGYSNCLAYNNGNHAATEIKSIDFTSYEAPITIHNGCSECGMAAPDKVIGALFTCIGYSIPDGERTGIAVTYSINTKGIEEYEALTKNTVEYGVFAVSKTKLGEDEIFGEDGAKANGVINTDLTSYKFGSVALKITGFDGYESKEFALGVYVKSSGKYSYLQKGEIATGDKYVFTSYNAIIDGINKQNEVA